MDIPRTNTSSKTPTAMLTPMAIKLNRRSRFQKWPFSASTFCTRSCMDWMPMSSPTIWESPIWLCSVLSYLQLEQVISQFCFLLRQPTLRHLENWSRSTFARLHWNFFWVEFALWVEGVCAYQCSEGLSLRPHLSWWTAALNSFGFHFASTRLSSSIFRSC